MGCVVPAGRHAFELRFDPWSWRLGLRTTLGGLIATAIICSTSAVSARRRKACVD